MATAKKKVQYRVTTAAETKALGALLAEELLAMRTTAARSGAYVVVLSGELGAGKTTFTQGFLKGLGIGTRAPSPTFIIMRRYSIKKKNSAFKEMFHMDAYRLPAAANKKNSAPLTAIGFGEITTDPRNILFIEWGERIKAAVPKGAMKISFKYGKKEGERIITFS